MEPPGTDLHSDRSQNSTQTSDSNGTVITVTGELLISGSVTNTVPCRTVITTDGKGSSVTVTETGLSVVGYSFTICRVSRLTNLTLLLATHRLAAASKHCEAIIHRSNISKCARHLQYLGNFERYFICLPNFVRQCSIIVTLLRRGEGEMSGDGYLLVVDWRFVCGTRHVNQRSAA